MHRILAVLFVISTIYIHGLEKDYKDKNFYIKTEYIARLSYTHHDDRNFKDEAQDGVYFTAFQLTKNHQYKNIGDIGCGSGYKLKKYFSKFNTVGFEIEPTLSFLKKKYPRKKWELSNFYQTPKNAKFDVLICADVIEHLINPDDLLNWINKIDFEYLILSTPDRDLLTQIWSDDIYGPQTQSGPPVNPAHVREWSFEELRLYLSEYFDIVDHLHCQKETHTQIAILRKKA